MVAHPQLQEAEAGGLESRSGSLKRLCLNIKETEDIAQHAWVQATVLQT